MRHHIVTLCILIILALHASAQVQGIQGSVGFTGKTVVANTNHVVSLSWTASALATSYNVYRSLAHGGPYTKIISDLTSTAGVDQNVQHAHNYYYVVTAVNGKGESGYSNEIVAAVP
jgi:fibronectin type 3 domain-containing protein